MRLDSTRSLAWRLRKHALDPASATTVIDVASRVIALRGWPADGADLAVCIRQEQPEPGALERALGDGELIRSYAFRGGSYVFAPDIAATVLAVRTTTRIWETKRWQQQGGFAIDDWEPLREAIRELLAEGPKSRTEIGARLARIPALRPLASAAAGTGADSLYKPLHWWGDICFGPMRDGQATFRLLRGDARWPGLPDIEEAGRDAVRRYLASYGPATFENLTYWLTEGLGAPRRRVLGWLAALGDEVTEVTVDGKAAYVRTADLDEIDAAEPSESVRLVPACDPWVLGPGTADTRLISAERRALASNGANLVIRRGVVTGTWHVRGGDAMVSWFAEAGSPPESMLGEAVRRAGSIRKQVLALVLRSG